MTGWESEERTFCGHPDMIKEENNEKSMRLNHLFAHPQVILVRGNQ
jgi:hypothetical protein